MKYQTESKRLAFQANLWKQETQELLDILDIRRGSLCLDVGCGPTGILEELSHRVGDAGKVVGFDYDLEYLTKASTRNGRFYSPNVLLVQGDIRNPPFRRNSFDLVHARFFLSLFKFPQRVIWQMLSLLKSEGIIAVQELDLRNISISPPSPQWSSIVDVIVLIFSALGNSEANRIAKELMFQSGIQGIHTRKVVLNTSHTHYANWIVEGIANSKDVLRQRGIMNDDEICSFIGNLSDLLERSQVSFPLIQTWGYKKA